MAIDLAEKQLKEGTASSQVVSHFLKLASSSERIDQRIKEEQLKLTAAKTDALKSQKKVEELYENALNAMRRYQGGGGSE